VIVTHYERPRLVKQALDALVVQSDRNFEVLLVDDGSQSDDAVAFLNRLTNGYCGLKLRVLRQQNRYVGAARNAGLRQAETSHVIFLDDDNVPFPNMVEVFRDAACASGAAAITCQMQVFTEPMAEPNLQVLFTGERWAFPGGPVALGAIRNVFGDATAIYRRDVLLSVGGFHEMHGVTHEDWQMHLRVILAGHHLLSLPVPLFWYRVVPDSMIHSTSIYDNMRVVVSALEERVPVDLRPLINIAVGITVR
jgi:glycosyltransferase involved in cell wall biosynthesis